MKGITKKLLAIVLATIMATSSFAASATAEEVYEDWYLDELYNQGLYEELPEWYLEEIGYYNDYYEEDCFYSTVFEDGIVYDVVICEDYSYASVASFDYDEDGNYIEKESVVIPETIECEGVEVPVTDISYMAFAESGVLREITLPATIETISDYAFSNCANLEKFEIPATAEIQYFGWEVFSGTPVFGYLAEKSETGEIIIGKNVLAAYLGNEKSYTVPEEITIIADYCFFMSGVEEVVLNENITSIEAYTFASCRNLKEITIPDTVGYIGDGAFSNCTNLRKVNLGDNLVTMGYRVFEGTKIKDIYLGDSVYDVIGSFAGCETLENISVSENNPYYTFEDDLLFFEESYEIEPEEITCIKSIEYFAFTSGKTSVTIPEEVATISAYAFYNCKELEEVNISSAIEIMGNAFTYCEFDNFDFSYVTSIETAAFKGCKNITSADLSSAWYIGDSAFENCTNLKDVTFSSDLWCINSRAFANTALEEVVISGYDCEVCEAAFANCSDLSYVKFDDGVWAIYNDIFTNCPSLEKVYISKTVENIDYDAFRGCSDVVFEIIKYSDSADIIVEYAEDEENDVTHYEFVGKVSFLARVFDFFGDAFSLAFEALSNWLFSIFG